MLHRKVKWDLPSIPFSLFNNTNNINAGHRNVKHAERTNERENRDEPPRLEQDQTVMFMKKPQEGKAQWSSGTVVSGDVQPLYTVEDDAAVHIKPFPGYAPIRPTTKVFFWKQCQQKHWTTRLRLVHRSQSQRPSWSDKLQTHHTTSKHPNRGVSLEHQ